MCWNDCKTITLQYSIPSKALVCMSEERTFLFSGVCMTVCVCLLKVKANNHKYLLWFISSD